MIRKIAAQLLTMLVLSGCGASEIPSSLMEEWDERNDPVHFSLTLNYQFEALPLSGLVAKRAWADSYWPGYRAGLADRWQQPDSDPFSYQLPSFAELQAMSPEELAGLSPAEKYDIYIGNYNYDLVKYERARTSPNDEGWFGLCHGWAPAALNFEEPQPITLTGAGGIQIPFGTSDIKGLLTFFQQFQRRPNATQFLGGRCNDDLNDNPSAGESAHCRDINAGTFHVTLANVVGLDNQGFVADIVRDRQVWNQPVQGYETTIVGYTDNVYVNAAPGTVKIVTVRTNLSYAVESHPHWNPLGAIEPYPYIASSTLSYTLELDAIGNILGGEWLQGERPDFFWRQTAPQFGGYFKELETIYQAAVRH